jgi:hypothetical protein
MREWWLRTALVLQSPAAVFVALRRDSDGEAAERAEPVLAIVLLAGTAFALTTGTAAHLLDDSDYNALLVAVWAFLAGAASGAFGYWLIGAVLHLVVRALGSHASYRRSRHLLAFAAVPVACSLVLWPIELALFGEKLFRNGGVATGHGEEVFRALTLGFALWAGVLLVIGIRSLHGWSWTRAALGAAAPIALAAAAVVL